MPEKAKDRGVVGSHHADAPPDRTKRSELLNPLFNRPDRASTGPSDARLRKLINSVCVTSQIVGLGAAGFTAATAGVARAAGGFLVIEAPDGETNGVNCQVNWYGEGQRTCRPELWIPKGTIC